MVSVAAVLLITFLIFEKGLPVFKDSVWDFISGTTCSRTKHVLWHSADDCGLVYTTIIALIIGIRLACWRDILAEIAPKRLFCGAAQGIEILAGIRPCYGFFGMAVLGRLSAAFSWAPLLSAGGG
jgi:ABC-type phosphate transport system permease subunit